MEYDFSEILGKYRGDTTIAGILAAVSLMLYTYADSFIPAGLIVYAFAEVVALIMTHRNADKLRQHCEKRSRAAKWLMRLGLLFPVLGIFWICVAANIHPILKSLLAGLGVVIVLRGHLQSCIIIPKMETEESV